MVHFFNRWGFPQYPLQQRFSNQDENAVAEPAGNDKSVKDEDTDNYYRQADEEPAIAGHLCKSCNQCGNYGDQASIP